MRTSPPRPWLTPGRRPRRSIPLTLLCALAGACSTSGAPLGGLPDGGGAPDLASPCGTPVAPAPGLVWTDRGAARGVQAGATWSWKGVPYAAPPTGDRRFRPPAEAACFPGVLDASQFGRSCLQLSGGTPVTVIGDEDCLTLNVWAPAGAPAGPLPVLVFFHGGGNVQGSSAEQSNGVYLYDAQALVEAAPQPVVVVTANYRLGALGFFAVPALDAEGDHHSSGNYGLLDQIAALRWVQRNVAAFGGDPGRVMIFGESAGGLDVCMLLVSPLTRGLFQRALIESGGCPGSALADAEAQDQALLPRVGCDGATDVAACLRAVPAATLAQQLPGVASVTGLDQGTHYGPVVDGYAIAGKPIEVLRAGQHQHVPFVMGTNADEASRAAPAVPTAQAYALLVHAAFGQALGDLVLARYPAASYPTPRAALVDLISDARFTCPARQVLRAAAGAQAEPARRYWFRHGLDSGPLKGLGAWHGLELLFVFDHLNLAGYQPSAAESALAASMVGYWTRFAASGDPNGGGAAPWPAYETALDPYLALDDTIAVGSALHRDACDFWDGLQ